MKAVSMSLLLLLLASCEDAEKAGREAAEQEAKEAQAKAVADRPIVRNKPPVPNEQRLSCANVIDVAGFQTALGEAEPISVVDNPKADGDAAAVCSLIRGGKKVSSAEQQARLKKTARLGVLPGDEMCRVTTYCWTVEDPDRFQKRCKERGLTPTDDLGFPACLQVVAQGADDVHSFSFYDDDTKCVIKVSGGPSMVDNAFIATCAKTARSLIGANSISLNPVPASDGAATEPSANDTAAPSETK